MKRLLLSLFALCWTLALLPSPFAAASTDPQVLRATLDNGLRVVIVRNDLAPVVTTQLNYLAGADETPPGFPGMAHAQEHMMFRGSPGLTADQLANIIAAMGGEFNAETQQTITQYYFTVPADDLKVALHVEALRMADSLDSDALWEKERGAIEQEVAQDLSNPEYRFYTQLLEKMYAGTPYAHDALGTKASFDKTTGAMLHKFHQDWYAPNNAILVIVGGVEPQATLAMVKELFGGIKTRPLPPHPDVKLSPLKAGSIRLETDRPYGMAIIAYRLPGYASPDYAAGQVLADVLSSQRGDLYALVPQGAALFAGFSAEPLPAACTGYALAAFPAGGDGDALVKRMQGIIAGYLKSGFPADLVAAAKRREIAAAEFAKNSIPGLADAWSQAVAVEGRQSPDDDLAAIARVTPADVERVARSYLDNARAVTAVLTPRPAGKPSAAKGFGGGESFAPSVTKPVALPIWARDVAASAETLPRALAPSDSVLPNGLRLIVLPSNISRTVSLFGAVKHNAALQAPKGQEGVDQVLGDLFEYGSTSRDRLAYRKALDDIAADASAGSSFSLQVLSEHFADGVELLADNLLHPALPKSAFEVVRRQTAASLAGELQSPRYLARRALHEGIYPKNDPALRQATPATVKKLSLDEVKAYYRQVFRPDLTTIVVVGDVDPVMARKVISRTFGAWRAKGPKPVTDLPPVPPNGPAASTIPDASRVQDEVTLAQTLDLVRSNPDYYPLQVGSHILAGAFYATRLYHDLREESGLVYTVEAALHAGKTRSNFAVFYACDPVNVSKARALVIRDLKQLQHGPASDAELRQAKTLLLRQLLLSRDDLDEVGSELLSLTQQDLPLDQPLRTARHYQKVSADQVQKAFARYLRPDQMVQVVLGPPPH